MHERQPYLKTAYDQTVLRGGKNCLNAEPTHKKMMWVMKILGRSEAFREYVRREFGPVGEKLSIQRLGIEIPVLGLPAGLCKNFWAIPVIGNMGMGEVTVGSVTALEWDGNPAKKREALIDGKNVVVGRIARFPGDATVVNRIGMPNFGSQKTAVDLIEARPVVPEVDLSVSITVHPGGYEPARLKLDLKESFETLLPANPKWIRVNVSCPNGVESQESRQKKLDQTCDLVTYAADLRRDYFIKHADRIITPLAVKLSPDMAYGDLRILLQTIKEAGIEGVVVTNSTTNREGERSKWAGINGGLTGPHLFELSLRMVGWARRIDRELGGNPLVIFGCGGIDSLDKCYQMKRAGADVFQVLTGFIFNPWIFRELDKQIRMGENGELRR